MSENLNIDGSEQELEAAIDRHPASGEKHPLKSVDVSSESIETHINELLDWSDKIENLHFLPTTKLSNTQKEQERKIGEEILQTPEKGILRRFYYKSPSTWVWEEDGPTSRQEYKYEVRQNVILKYRNNSPGVAIDIVEANNLSQAAAKFVKTIAKKIYYRDI